MTKDEALKLALEALETSMYPQQKQLQAIDAIKEALAESEPWEKFCDSNCVWTDHHPDCELAQRKPLTDEEIMDLCRSLPTTQYTTAFARAIEAAHGIKENT
jgi:hypothetical protein